MSWSLWQKKICSLYNACLLNTQQFIGKDTVIPQCSEPNGCDSFVILRVLNSRISANSHQSPPKTGKPAKILRQGPTFVYEELWRCYYRDPVIWCMHVTPLTEIQILFCYNFGWFAGRSLSFHFAYVAVSKPCRFYTNKDSLWHGD